MYSVFHIQWGSNLSAQRWHFGFEVSSVQAMVVERYGVQNCIQFAILSQHVNIWSVAINVQRSWSNWEWASMIVAVAVLPSAHFPEFLHLHLVCSFVYLSLIFPFLVCWFVCWFSLLLSLLSFVCLPSCVPGSLFSLCSCPAVTWFCGLLSWVLSSFFWK